MLWPEGRASLGATNIANYAKFVQSGHLAAKAVFPQTLTLVHVANGFDNGLFKWNIGGLLDNGAQFDVIAMSLYPDKVSDWPAIAQQARNNMDDMVQRYQKPVMVSEIGLSVSAAQDSKDYITKVIELTQGVSNNQGLGVFWWEPKLIIGAVTIRWLGLITVAPPLPWMVSKPQVVLLYCHRVIILMCLMFHFPLTLKDPLCLPQWRWSLGLKCLKILNKLLLLEP